MIRHINYPRSLPTELLVHSHAPHSAQTNPGERLPKLSWKASSCQRAFYNSVQGAVVAPPAPRQIRRSAGGAAQAVSRREAGSGALTARRRRRRRYYIPTRASARDPGRAYLRKPPPVGQAAKSDGCHPRAAHARRSFGSGP